MSLTSFLILVLTVLSFVAPVMLGIGLALWWRRTGHWSFAVLALAMVVFCIAQVVISIDQRILQDPKSSNRAAPEFTHHMERLLIANALFYLVLTFGGAGLIFAARVPEGIRAPNKPAPGNAG
jgi:hypothetical protein